jgi:CheY-like chemotaxis protein
MPGLSGGIVSIVDDDASLRRSLRNLLSSAGFEVRTFESAEAFLQSVHQENCGCLILDLRMPPPGMGGFELLAHLRATDSRIPVILLTAHGNRETRERALRAGANAYLDKPCDGEVLLEVVGQAVNPRPGQPIHFAGGTLNRHRHICAFFNSADDEHRVLHSFVKEGLERGEKAFHIVDPDLRDDYVKRLAHDGMDVDGAIATGQMEVVPWQDVYLRGGRFEQDAMLKFVEQMLQSSAAAGYPLTRAVAHMEWALLDLPGVDDLVEYETRLNYVLPKYKDPVICAYDLTRFGAGVAMDIMRTHPAVIIGGMLQVNPFFVPPDQLLRELRDRSPHRTAFATC